MTEQPKTFPSIQGRCPACRGDSLFIGTGGYVTCSRLDCPNPSAADQMLHGETPPQAVLARIEALAEEYPVGIDTALIHEALDTTRPTTDTPAVSSDDSVMPAGTPTPDWQYAQEECPHCDQPQYGNRMDEHLATAHANIPPCTATLDNETSGGTLTCVLRAGHRSWYALGYYWHVSARGPVGRHVWNDTATGAQPHREEQPGA